MTDNARSERMIKEKNALSSHYRTILNRNLGIFLKDALQSRLLGVIRQHPENLKVTEGGCTLWKRRAWVESLLDGRKEKDNDRGITEQ